MVEGDVCRKRKFVCFILLTLLLIFCGMCIQYKMNVLQVPVSILSKNQRYRELVYGRKRNGDDDSEDDRDNDHDDDHSDHSEDENEEDIQGFLSEAKSMQKSVATGNNGKNEKSVQNAITSKNEPSRNMETHRKLAVEKSTTMKNNKQTFREKEEKAIEKTGNSESKKTESRIVSDGRNLHHLLQEYGLDNEIDVIKKLRFTAVPNSLNNIALATRTTESTRKHSNVLVQHLVEKEGEFKKRFPSVIIAGVKKGGTRALLSFLGKHPLVRSGGKEMHFFDKNDRYEKGLPFYLDQMPKSFANEITIEKTPGYFVKPYVPERIYNFNKDTKLLFIFRDPVQRAISDYAQALSKDGKQNTRFERLVFTNRNPRIIDINNSKVSIGLYVEHLKNWLQYFSLKQMYFVNGDQFIQNPVAEIINVQRFLKLPVIIDQDSFYFNKTKGFYCIVVKREVDGEISADCLGSTKGRKHPSIKTSTLQRLTDFYRPYNKKLYKLINKNFHWPV